MSQTINGTCSVEGCEWMPTPGSRVDRLVKNLCPRHYQARDDITRLEKAIAYLQRGGVWEHTEPAGRKVMRDGRTDD